MQEANKKGRSIKAGSKFRLLSDSENLTTVANERLQLNLQINSDTSFMYTDNSKIHFFIHFIENFFICSLNVWHAKEAQK